MTKDKQRESRLHWTNQAEHVLRQELNDIALQKCNDKVKQFATCAQESGMLVIWKCREENQDMNCCLREYTNATAFEQYKRTRQEEIIH